VAMDHSGAQRSPAVTRPVEVLMWPSFRINRRFTHIDPTEPDIVDSGLVKLDNVQRPHGRVAIDGERSSLETLGQLSLLALRLFFGHRRIVPVQIRA
jgi:hypothetical protein